MTTGERFRQIEQSLADAGEKIRTLAIIADQNESRAA